jgi:hypothetical protein
VEPRTIRESRLKVSGFLAGAIGLMAIGIWMVKWPDHASDVVWGWVDLVLCGAGALVFAWLLVKPQVLRLDEQGFTLDGGLLRRPRQVAWADVDRFFIYRGPRGVKIVGYNYRPGRAPQSALRKIASVLGAESDGDLPRNWTISPEALVALLNDYHAECAAAAQPPQPQIVS